MRGWYFWRFFGCFTGTRVTVPKAYENGVFLKTSKSVARTSLRSCGIRTKSVGKKWSIGSVGATPPPQGPPSWRPKIGVPRGQFQDSQPPLPPPPSALEMLESRQTAIFGHFEQIEQKSENFEILPKNWRFFAILWSRFFRFFASWKFPNRKRGGVHFKIINGKIRGREMQSVVGLVERAVLASYIARAFCPPPTDWATNQSSHVRDEEYKALLCNTTAEWCV